MGNLLLRGFRKNPGLFGEEGRVIGAAGVGKGVAPYLLQK